ncbi:hypothetical protein I7I53_01793 [Histoplasma capsulatum var. duboisii H88]|uniref:Uncharacterized protein n=1 Tax=Ajellomyces capsulatus (strain H88) TaxID=544711 RepID=A0A8A1LLE8_AJEC8|nr:hypothetical protein I7I53_01793 [Histoplasma capsulatum var. duboisii H88]
MKPLNFALLFSIRKQGTAVFAHYSMPIVRQSAPCPYPARPGPYDEKRRANIIVPEDGGLVFMFAEPIFCVFFPFCFCKIHVHRITSLCDSTCFSHGLCFL